MYGNGNVFVCCFVNVVAVALDCTVGAMLVLNTYTATADQARRCEADAKARITIVTVPVPIYQIPLYNVGLTAYAFVTIVPSCTNLHHPTPSQ